MELITCTAPAKHMASSICKICVVGPPSTGKSLLCKVVANQALFPNARYDPTEVTLVRMQRYQSAAASGQTTTVHLWDCSGSPSALEHSGALSEGADGVVLVYNPSKASHEQELERMYKDFVQPLNLAKQQCMVLSLSFAVGHSIHTALTGRLGQLQQQQVDIHPEDPTKSQPQLARALDSLVSSCVARQKEQAEDDVIEATQL